MPAVGRTETSKNITLAFILTPVILRSGQPRPSSLWMYGKYPPPGYETT